MKHRKPKIQLAASNLSESDWNFDAVPDAELVACCYWEYARESACIRELRQRCMKEQRADRERDQQLHQDLQRVQSIGYPAWMFLHGFFCPPDGVLPDAFLLRPGEVHRLTGSFPKPWQMLTREEREYRAYVPQRGVVDSRQVVPFARGYSLGAKDILRAVAAQRQSCDEANQQVRRQYPKLPDEALIQMNKLRYPNTLASVVYGSGAEATVVEINWGIFTNEEIIQEFRKWVKANRPKDVPKPDNKGHKPGDWRAQLTRLAVMRLLARFTPLEIVDPRQDKCPAIWQTIQFSRPKWRDVTKWHDARREAGKLFHSLFPFLPKNDQPISWNRQAPRK